MRTDLKIRISNYENWISSGCKGKKPDDMQKELLKLFYESKEAYTFYRNYLYRISLVLNGESTELDEFIKFLNKNKHLPEYSDIVSYYSSEKILDSFDDKRMNVIEIASENIKDGISQNSCFLYQSYYEIEIILLVFASFSILNSEFRIEFDHNNLKDRSGRLRKGVCFDFIKARLKSFPELLEIFSSAYNIKLRNTIGHNNYRIKGGTIESLDGAIKIEQAEFFKSLYNLQKLNNFLIYFFSSESLDTDKLKDYGILSIGFSLEKELPILFIHQLECFYHLDKEKRWFNLVEFNICGNKLETTLFSRTPMKGEYNNDLVNWFESLKKQDTLLVKIQPITPPINETKELLEIDCGSFEICDKKFETKVKYNIKYVS